MPTSGQITAKIKSSENPHNTESELWAKTRYLVAQKPASSSTITTDGYYKGRHVIAGVKADPTLSPLLKDQSYESIKHKYYIRFTDNLTTDNADETIGQALYTIMDNTQADEYEDALRAKR